MITDEERTTFQLSDKQLKEDVEKYFGKKPDDAYLHSPTPGVGGGRPLQDIQLAASADRCDRRECGDP